jgi:hypothetical protein
MNYQKIHDSIIEKAKKENRSKIQGVYERHHIIMTSVGGLDTEENTVLLTLKEHFIVHYILWKMNPHDKRYRDPILMFKHKGAHNSRLYESARLSHIKYMKENNPSLTLSEESRRSKSEKLKQYVKTPEHRRKIGIKAKGNKIRAGAVLSEKSKRKISDSVLSWHKNVGVSVETREKLRMASTGRKHTQESLEKQKQRALNRQKFKCPHCENSYDSGNLKQHMIKHGFSQEQIEEAKMKPEGWVAPSHEGNHGTLSSS